MAVVLTHTAATSAHGPPAGVTSVAAMNSDGPTVVQVSEGLAQRINGAWHYVCPTQFGDELSPLALSVDGLRTFVVGSDDLFVLEADGTVTPQNTPDFSRRFVTGLGAVGDRLFAFRYVDRVTEIREVTAAAASAIWSDAAAYDSVAADDDGFWVARATADGMGHVTHLDVTGAAVAQYTFVVEPGELVLRVLEFQGDLYVSTLTGAQTGRLTRLNADGAQTRIIEADEPLRGPIATDIDSAFVVADGVLESLPPGSPAALLNDRATCIGQIAGHAYVCSRAELMTLGSEGPAGVLFDLAEIQGPLEGAASDDAASRCALKWHVFEGDLRAVGVLPEVETAPTTTGCSISRLPVPHAVGGIVPIAGVLALLVVRRLRARR